MSTSTPQEDKPGTVRRLGTSLFIKLTTPASEPWHVIYSLGPQRVSGWQSHECMEGAKVVGYAPLAECYDPLNNRLIAELAAGPLDLDPETATLEEVLQHTYELRARVDERPRDLIEGSGRLGGRPKLDKGEIHLAKWLVSLDDPIGTPGGEERRTINLTQIIARAHAVLSRSWPDWYLGPTATDPDPLKMWHHHCGQEVLFIKADGETHAACGCGQQWDSYGASLSLAHNFLATRGTTAQESDVARVATAVAQHFMEEGEDTTCNCGALVVDWNDHIARVILTTAPRPFIIAQDPVAEVDHG